MQHAKWILESLPQETNWLKAESLQMYVFLACQEMTGGLKDKPGKSPDYYHTCYSLSGTSAAQTVHRADGVSISHVVGAQDETSTGGDESSPEKPKSRKNDPKLHQIDAFYNIGLDKSAKISNYFSKQPRFVSPKGEMGREGAGVEFFRKRFDL